MSENLKPCYNGNIEYNRFFICTLKKLYFAVDVLRTNMNHESALVLVFLYAQKILFDDTPLVYG